MHLYVDADACPVKDEVLKVAVRHNLRLTFIGNSWMRGLDHPLVDQVVAPEGLDAADNLIAEKIEPGDIVITADIPLAGRCLAKGARGIDHRGKVFDEASIGMAVAVRNLMTSLRDTGQIEGGGPSGYAKQDRSRFLDGLERVVQAMKKGV